MADGILKDIIIIFIVAVPIIVILHYFKIPSIIGFLVTGSLIGPFGLGWIGQTHDIQLLAEIGIALLLFSAGLEFSFKHLWSIRRVTLLGGSLQVGLTVLATFLVGQWIGWHWFRSLFFGCIVALSSTAVVLDSLMRHRWIDSPFGRISTGILLFQDISLLPIMILLPGIAVTGGLINSDVDIWEFAYKIGLLVAGLVLFSIWGIKPLLNAVAKTRSKELFVTTVIALAIGIAALTKQVGLSFAIGSFFAGMIIGLTHYRHHALAEISPFRYVFSALFFVSIGMLFNSRFLLDNPVLVTGLVIGLPIMKVLLIVGIVLLFGFSVKTAVITGLLLGELGEFSFLLATLGLDLGIIQPHLHQLIINLVVITLFVTPVVVHLAPFIGEFVYKWKWTSKLQRKRDQHSFAPEKPLKNHVIICGFGPLGESIGYFLEEIKTPYVILELNPMTAHHHMKKNRLVLIGDGASQEMLQQAHIETAKAIAVTAPDYMNIVAIIRQAKLLNPNVQVITRARYRNQTEDLYSEGADIVISEELESGIEMGRHLLDFFGMPKEEIKTKIEKIREFGSSDFF